MSEKLDHIDDFFKGELDAEQLELFEKRVLEDPDFADEVAFYLSAVQTLRTGISEDRKAHFTTLYNAETKPSFSTFRLWPYLSAAAAIVLILLGVYFFYPNRSAPAIAQSYINKNLSTLSVMMNATEDSIQRGVRLYNENKLDEASQTFEQILKTHPEEYKVMEYAGIVSLRLNNYDNALAHFERLSKATQLYANSGNFYISLTYLKRNRPGDVQKAKAMLTKIVEEHAANEEAARELLKRL
jgi:tetratricopeptide (TPR) repeat protein